MFKINIIKEEFYILDYLNKRWILNQYKKSKNNILSWNYSWNKIWLKEPKKDLVVYFRINKQFRALYKLEGNSLIVFEIDNHQ